MALHYGDGHTVEVYDVIDSHFDKDRDTMKEDLTDDINNHHTFIKSLSAEQILLAVNHKWNEMYPNIDKRKFASLLRIIAKLHNNGKDKERLEKEANLYYKPWFRGGTRHRKHHKKRKTLRKRRHHRK